MAIISGVVDFGSRPVDSSQLDAVQNFYDANYPPGTSYTWQGNGVLLKKRDSTDALSFQVSDRDDDCFDKNGYAIVADSRIDNREQLLEKLAIPKSVQNAVSDSQLLLRAYWRWGEDCPSYFLGDFVFAIWDEKRAKLFCARDHMGVKPFYYARKGQVFVFSSDAEALVEQPMVSAKLSDLSIARFLLEGDLFDESGTFYDAVSKLPPAHTLTTDATDSRHHRYWHPEDAPYCHFRNEQCYVDQLRELMEKAVLARLPSKGPVAAHLSGGLDSSAITAIAGSYLAGSSQILHSWSWMQKPKNEKERYSDEWRIGAHVAESSGARHHFTHMDAATMLPIFHQGLLRRQDTVDLWYEFPLREAASDLDINVMLSGWGGDQFISFYGNYRHAETFWRGQIVPTLRDIWRESNAAHGRLRRFGANCGRSLLLPVLPSQINGRAARARRVQRQYLSCATDDFLAFALQHKTKRVPYLGNCIRTGQLRYLEQRFLFSRIDSWSASGARRGIEYRYPWLDKRIVEFALGIPAEMYRSRGNARHIMRKAMQRWLPDEVCYSNMKAEPQRVASLYSTLHATLQRWLDTTPARFSDRISREKLVKMIQGLRAPGLTIQRADVDSAITAVKSIHVVNL
ncbi:MAG: asparagine synthase-related protein [Pseudomonadota bacterium]